MSTIFSELFSTEFLFLPFSSSRPNERKVESCIHEKMRNQTFDDLTGVNRTPTRRNIVASSVFLDGVRNRTRLKNKKGMSFLIEHHGFCRILYKLILLFQKFTKHPWILEHERIYRIFEVGVRFSVEISRYRTQKIPRIFLSRNQDLFRLVSEISGTLANTGYSKFFLRPADLSFLQVPSWRIFKISLATNYSGNWHLTDSLIERFSMENETRRDETRRKPRRSTLFSPQVNPPLRR